MSHPPETPAQSLQQIFELERPRLLNLAYRMTGMFDEAEDVLQEAWLRWHKADLTVIEKPGAWLTTVVTRLCIDHLRSVRRSRIEYTGPWLPEPCLTVPSPDPEANAEMASSLSVAFLLILEKLTPAERAVFLLHEAFDYDHDEIAAIVGKTGPACRQILSRAKTRLAALRPNFNVDAQEHQRLLHAFGEAVASGDLQLLLGLFAQDIEFWSDGGGKAPAALNVVYGAKNVARFFVASGKKFAAEYMLQERHINGLAGVLASRDSIVDFALTIETHAGYIQHIFMVLNPDKLTRMH